jgi:hypothetical protein
MLARERVHLLRKESKHIRALAEVLEQRAGFLPVPEASQGINQPEGAS